MVKILVTDDSAFMRRILINALKKENYNDIIEGEDGTDAVALYEKEKPDLVLLDIVMKNMEGIEALKKIIEMDPNAKVAMITAVGQEQMVREAMSSGARDYIVKPFDSAKVIETVQKILNE